MTQATTTSTELYQPRCYVNYDVNFPAYTFITILVDVDLNQGGSPVNLPSEYNSLVFNLNFEGNFTQPNPREQSITKCLTLACLSSDVTIFTSIQLTDAGGEIKQGTVSRPIGREDDIPGANALVAFTCWPVVFKSVTNGAFFSGGVIAVTNGSDLGEMMTMVDAKNIHVQVTSSSGGDGSFTPFYGVIDGVPVGGEFNLMTVVSDTVAQQFPIGYFIDATANPPINLYTSAAVIDL